MTSFLVLTVWCGDCKDEHRSSPGRLGEVRRWPSGLVRWGTEDRRGQFPEMGGRGQKMVAFDTLNHPTRTTYTPPERLPALCERHGNGSVATRDVIGKSGNVVLHMVKATT